MASLPLHQGSGLQCFMDICFHFGIVRILFRYCIILQRFSDKDLLPRRGPSRPPGCLPPRRSGIRSIRASPCSPPGSRDYPPREGRGRARNAPGSPAHRRRRPSLSGLGWDLPGSLVRDIRLLGTLMRKTGGCDHPLEQNFSMATIRRMGWDVNRFLSSGAMGPAASVRPLHDLFLDFKEKFSHSSSPKNTHADWNPNEAQIPCERVCSTQFLRRLRAVKKLFIP